MFSVLFVVIGVFIWIAIILGIIIFTFFMGIKVLYYLLLLLTELWDYLCRRAAGEDVNKFSSIESRQLPEGQGVNGD